MCRCVETYIIVSTSAVEGKKKNPYYIRLKKRAVTLCTHGL